MTTNDNTINGKEDLKNTISNHIEDLITSRKTIAKTTDEILNEILKDVSTVDFKMLAFPELDEYNMLLSIISEGKELSKAQNEEFETLKFNLNKFSPNKNHYLVICIEQLLKLTQLKELGLCKKNGNIFLYNGTYWSEIDKERFQSFLGEVALKMGVEKFKGKIHTFKDELHKQFMSEAYLPNPKEKNKSILINLLNGTYEIYDNNRKLRDYESTDFITHQLPFNYDEKATSPLFENYLNEVLPDVDKQKVFAEFCGYIFVKPSFLKLEKILILFGSGANGKSVFFEILNALLGKENVSNFSLQSLTNENGYYRAKIANKLVNYASEINGKLETDIFKQIASGEPIEARLPYGEPFILTEYAKLIFNCNELPKDVEHTNAFFRRFLIIGFDITIPENKQDKDLANKIIKNELSGVFNWVLKGLDRLIEQKQFSKCEAIDNARVDYEKQSDSVQLFISEYEYKSSASEYMLISSLYPLYKNFCVEDGYRPVGKTKFIQRLIHYKIHVKRINIGNVAYITNQDF